MDYLITLPSILELGIDIVNGCGALIYYVEKRQMSIQSQGQLNICKIVCQKQTLMLGKNQ